MSKSKLESEITVHNIGYEDIDEVVNLSQVVFGPRIAYRREQLKANWRFSLKGKPVLNIKKKS